MNNPDINKAAKYFENIFTFAHVGVVIVDQDCIILRANPAFTKILGYEENEILGKPFYILTSKDNVKHESSSYSPLYRFSAAEKSSMEYRFCDKNGHDVPIRFRSFITRDEQGQVTEALGILEQIVELTGTDESGSSLAKKMWEAQQNFENVLENSADAVLICDNSGNITMANKTFLQMLHYTQKEVIGEFIVNFTAVVEGTYTTTTGEEIIIDQECVNNAGARSAELFDKGYIKNWETYFVRKDKVHVPIDATLSVMKDKDGQRRGSIVILRNITERKKAEKETREAKEFLERVLENTADGIMICDLLGNIVNVNAALENMTGLGKKELIGKHASKVVIENKEIKKRTNEGMTALFETGYTSYEAVIKRNDGKHREVEFNCSLIKDEKGEYIAGVSILRDITDRKRMEQQLLQSEKLKSLGELAGGVAHNFNNALAIILGRTQLLKINIGPPPDKGERRKSIIELQKGLKIIERASLDGAETVRRIQEFARRRDDDKYFTSVDMNKIIDDALEFTKLQWKDGAESKGIKINITKKLSALPFVSGSAAELREVVTNLINNAIFAMPQGGTITVKTFQKGGYVCIKVQDTGMGISRVIRDRIFDPFFTTKGPQSSGLGMSVSYGIVERHRGTISVDSLEGKGTTFTIEIPFSEKTVEEVKVVPISRGQKKVNILIVEDEEDVRNVLKDILTHAGHRVETASNGKLGIEKFKKNNFDMVLTDLGMPGISGWQVAEKIKAINGKVPLALITGWSIDLNKSEMNEKGIDFIIKKPYKLDQLVNVVQEGMILRDKFQEA